jgi:hypothetical protein
MLNEISRMSASSFVTGGNRTSSNAEARAVSAMVSYKVFTGNA